ncbi:hypothetical protein TELCIR_14682, partial [Teladorsagia circumcincta]
MKNKRKYTHLLRSALAMERASFAARERGDAEACLKPRVDGLVKLQFTDCKGRMPLSEPKELKLRFDRIFRLTRFVKAMEVMKKMKKDYYVHQRDSCNALRKESKEKIRDLDAKIKVCAEIIEKSNQKLLEIEELERKAEIKQAELRMLNEQLGTIKVAPYPGTEKELRAEIHEIDSSTEFQELETKRDRLKASIDSITRDIARMIKEKDEAENEMRNAVSLKMMENDVRNDVHNIERQLVVAYGFRGPDYVGELDSKIAFEEKEIQDLREASNIERRRGQNQVDAAQMELTRLTCEANSLLSSVEQRKREIEIEERKLQKANLSQQHLCSALLAKQNIPTATHGFK